MNFTDLEIALLKGAPILSCCGDEIDADLKNNYEYADFKKLDNFCVWIGDADWKDKSKEPSTFVRWMDIQKPQGVGENENCLLWAASFIKIYLVFNYLEAQKELDTGYKEMLERTLSADRLINFLDPEGEGLKENVEFPEFLATASMLLSCVDANVCPSVVWWQIRCSFLNQKLLEEKSPSLHLKIKQYMSNQEFSSVLSTHKDLSTLYHCELVDIYLFYYDVVSAKSSLTMAEEENGLIANTLGVLGKRTKYQQTALPQLAIKLSRITQPDQHNSKDVFNTLPPNSHPQVCQLTDDTRLDKIAFENSTENAFDRQSLTSIDYVYILSKLIFVKKSQPKDEMHNEELEAFLSVLIDDPLLWGVKMTALYQRSVLECNHRRTVERSLEQLEILTRELKASQNSQQIRYQYFFACGHATCSEVETTMADIWLSLGCTKDALFIYNKLNVWEKSIECYQKLELRHKAEEIIRDELAKKETVKLWVLLGDVTDNTEYYEKAWEFSSNKSGRCQRQWGYYFFRKKQYDKAAEHFEIAVKLNGLEYSVWSALGYSLMECKKWEECAKAYLHCVNLNYEDFEAWNNLGAAYKELKKYKQALNALTNALKCDYEVCKIWENVITIGLILTAVDDVLTAYNRVLDLKSNKFIDVEALTVVSYCITHGKEDVNGKNCFIYKKRALELLGRITANESGNGHVWGIYADLLLASDNKVTKSSVSEETYFRSLQCGEKCIRMFMQKTTWPTVENEASKIVYSLQSFVANVKDFCILFPESSSRKEWTAKAGFFFNQVKASLDRSVKNMLQVPSKYPELMEILATEQQNVEGLNNVGSI